MSVTSVTRYCPVAAQPMSNCRTATWSYCRVVVACMLRWYWLLSVPTVMVLVRPVGMVIQNLWAGFREYAPGCGTASQLVHAVASAGNWVSFINLATGYQPGLA